MKISIVTACMNMEDYIGETLKSVPAAVEHIVVDGGSTDKTWPIVQSFEKKLSVMISEQDEGQYHAISKGFEHASGEIMGWVNADDILMPWTASVVTEIFERFPDVMWITGTPSFLNDAGQLVQSQNKTASYPQKFIQNGRYSREFGGYLQQENMFWRRSLWEKSGGLDLSYRLAADFDLWTRFAKHAPLISVATPLAAFRERPGQQASSRLAEQYEAEVLRCCKKFKKPSWIWRFLVKRGVVAQNLCRSFIWRGGQGIVYSRKTRAWHMVKTFRSIGRVGFGDLVTQFRIGSEK